MTTTAPPQAVMKAALQAYVDRTNAGDAAGLVALFAPDAVFLNPAARAALGERRMTAESCPVRISSTLMGSCVTVVVS